MNHPERQEQPGREEYRALRAFTTRVWEHPLLDQETVVSRSELLDAAGEVLGQFLGKQGYVAFPLGSFRWIMDAESDLDLRIIIEDTGKDGLRNIGGKLTEISERLKAAGIQVEDDTIIFMSDIESDNDPTSLMTSLYLTPDNYVIGDRQLAQRLRAQLANLPEAMYKSAFRNMIDYFELIKQWPSDGKYLAIHGFAGEKPAHRTRAVRYATNTVLRGQQLRNPALRDHYPQLFAEALERLQVPSAETFKRGLAYSQGALELHGDYRAKGIST